MKIKMGWTFLAVGLLMACSKDNNEVNTEVTSITGKTWELSQSTENGQTSTYPLTIKGDFDGDGTEERLSRDDYYVFSIPWCYTAYISNVLDDQGSDTQTLALENGVLQMKHLNRFNFNAARDSMYFNGHAYAYFNDGETIVLRKGNYEAAFELETNIGPNEVLAFYEEEG